MKYWCIKALGPINQLLRNNHFYYSNRKGDKKIVGISKSMYQGHLKTSLVALKSGITFYNDLKDIWFDLYNLPVAL